MGKPAKVRSRAFSQKSAIFSLAKVRSTQTDCAVWRRLKPAEIRHSARMRGLAAPSWQMAREGVLKRE
jgi:hypothetical protein